MNTKHTPGPWKVNRREHEYKSGVHLIEIRAGYIHKGTGLNQILVAEVNNYSSPEVPANANLIAAAPEMLEALETFVNNFKEMKSLNWDAHELEKRRLIDISISHYREVESLIRKANGEL